MAATTELEKLIVRLVGDASEYRKMLKDAESATLSAETRFRNMGASMTAAITLPLTVLGGVAVKAFSDFDTAMTNSTAIMQTTEEQMVRLRDTAVTLSSEVTHSATQLAEAYLFLAQAGKNVEQSMALLPTVSKFAQAGNFNLALATDLLTDAQSALGLSTRNVTEDTKNLVRISDVLIKANTLANANAQQFSEALTRQAGTALKIYSKDVEEGTAVLAAYAEQGIKGRIAGGELSRATRILSKSAIDNADAHKMLGFQVFDTNGKMRNYADIIANLEDITSSMSDEMRSATLDFLGFEVKIQQAILPLIGMSDKIREYEKELRAAGGTTEDVSEKQMQSLSAQMKVLRNNINTVFIEIGRNLLPIVKALAAVVQNAVDIWKSFDATTQSVIVYVGVTAAAIGPLMLGIYALNKAAVAAGVGMASLSRGLIAANTAALALRKTLGLLVVVGVLAWTFQYLSGLKALNKELEESVRLEKERLDIWANRVQTALEEASKIEDPFKKTEFLTKEYEQARANARGYEKQIESLGARIKKIRDSELFKNQEAWGTGFLDSKNLLVDVQILEQELVQVRERFKQSKEQVIQLRSALEEASTASAELAKNSDATVIALRNIGLFQGELAEINKKLTPDETLSQKWGRLVKELEAVKEITPEVKQQLNQVGWELSQTINNQRLSELSKAMKDVNESVLESLESIQKQRLELTKTEVEMKVLEFRRALASISERMTNADKAYTQGLIDQYKAQYDLLQIEMKQESLKREAISLTERLLDPMQKYTKEVEHLKKLQPFLDPVTFDKAMKEAKDRLDQLTDSTKEARRELEMLDAAMFRSVESRKRIAAYADVLRGKSQDGKGAIAILKGGPGNPQPNINPMHPPIKPLVPAVPIPPAQPIVPPPVINKINPVVPPPQAPVKPQAATMDQRSLQIAAERRIKWLQMHREAEKLLAANKGDLSVLIAEANKMEARMKAGDKTPDLYEKAREFKIIADIFKDEANALEGVRGLIEVAEERLRSGEYGNIPESKISPDPVDKKTTSMNDNDKGQKEIIKHLASAVKLLDVMAKKEGIEIDLANIIV